MSIDKVRTGSSLEDVQPNQQKTFGLMGESLSFQTNDDRLLAIADEAFGRFPLSDDRSEPPLIVRLFVREGHDHGEKPLQARQTKPIYHQQDHIFTILVGADNFAVADLSRGFAYGFITPELLDDRDFVRINFIEAMSLCLLGFARNYAVVHAACVIKDELSVLIHGKAGSGKSTLAFACVRRGYKILAEDVVFCKSQSGELQLWGAPWKFHLLPDAKQLFPELHDLGRLVTISGEAKIELDLEALYPGCTRTNARAGILILLTRNSDQPIGIAKLSRRQAMQEFEFHWPWSAGWNDQLEANGQRLLDGEVYRLNLNRTPEQGVDILDELLVNLRERYA